jgi:hypothetical protein
LVFRHGLLGVVYANLLPALQILLTPSGKRTGPFSEVRLPSSLLLERSAQ